MQFETHVADVEATYRCRRCGADLERDGTVFLHPERDGRTTECPIDGVHEHTFRGPHGFREWLIR